MVDMFCRDLTAAAAAGFIDPVRLPNVSQTTLCNPAIKLSGVARS